MKHVVALSGGKDSTALALRLAEIDPHEYTYLITPTGDELTEMNDHWEQLECLLKTPLTRVTNQTLDWWIAYFHALPNWRQRWCTRLLKIEPCLAWIKANGPAILHVGLRADEELREGIYSTDVECRFDLREWGWGLPEVAGYLKSRDVTIPKRTECAKCFGQRLYEWKALYRLHPDRYAEAEFQEELTGHTFRSPGRDKHPAALKDLRVLFDKGKSFKGDQTDLFAEQGPCRVCTL